MKAHVGVENGPSKLMGVAKFSYSFLFLAAMCVLQSRLFFFFDAVLKFHFVFSRLRKSSSPDLFVGFYKK